VVEPRQTEMAEPGYVGVQHYPHNEAICIENLTYAYPDGTVALKDINLHVAVGSTLAIIGPNGAGKTTLLKIMLGLLEGYTGSVRIMGMTPQEARRRGDVVSWVPQKNQIDWRFPITVRDAIRLGLVGKTGLFRRYRSDDLDYVEHLLDVLELKPMADRPVGSLSGGMQQRVLIGRALAPRPKILMLDEPTVGVDEPRQRMFHQLMAKIHQAFNLTLVIVSHDLRAVLASCQRVACLNQTLHFHDVPARLGRDVLTRVFRCELEGLPMPIAARSDTAGDV